MNETEWLSGTNPYTMLDYLAGQVSERKLRLFACACVRSKWHLIPYARQRGTVELAERLAEGTAAAVDLEDARQRAEQWSVEAPEFEGATYQAAGQTIAEVASEAARNACTLILQQGIAEALIELIPGENMAKILAQTREAEGRALCRLALEVFGNPFRPVVIEPAWLASSDGAPLAMARWIDDEQRFDELPYLADALTDAGCGDEVLLRHLREGWHVRGCWALDAILRRP